LINEPYGSYNELSRHCMKNTDQVKSIIRAVNILECFLENERLTFKEICRKTNLSNGTVYRILETLIDKNFVSRDSKTEKYLIGKGIFVLGNLALKNYEFEKIAHPVLEELVTNTKETANASIFYDNSIIFIDSVDSPYSIKMNVKIGHKTNINSSASGKAILAYFTEDKIDEVLEYANLPKLTINSITDKELFKKELNEVKINGYALDNEEEEIGLKCVAGPVFNYEGKIEGAISISGLASRVDPSLNEFIAAIKEACSEVSLKMGYLNKK
jgi:IclR family transcriptional regulator, KDG regulon repressor